MRPHIVAQRTLRSAFLSFRNYSIKPSLIEELAQRAEEYRLEIGRHVRSGPEGRRLRNQLSSITRAISEIEVRRKLLQEMFELPQKPGLVSLEVLSNGTTHMTPIVCVRATKKTYLFNCPEGTSRFLPSLRVRPAPVEDLFITRSHWDCIGGVLGFLLSKEPTDPPCRIHGPRKMKFYLESVRPLADSDTMKNHQIMVEEVSYDQGKYEDGAVTVHYIPLFSMQTDPSVVVSPDDRSVDTCFLMELTPPNRRIDIGKLAKLRIPKGPVIGKLKDGQTVTLPDGRVINPNQVLVDDADNDVAPNIFIVDCVHEDKMESLFTNGLLQDYTNGKKQMNYVVHFTPNTIVMRQEYRNWMSSFGPRCFHLIANGQGESLPMMDGIYRQQIMLNQICPDLFPSLFPYDFNGMITQDVDLTKSNQIRPVKTLEKYPMRGKATNNDAATISLVASELEGRIKDNDNVPNALNKFKKDVKALDLSGSCYPTLAILGTASAVPMKYRNVSAYWLQLTPESSILVDCGEGTYGQLKVMHGPEKIDEVMRNLSAIFITHAHLDHMAGLYTIIERRLEAFKRKNVPYEKLLLVCNRNVRRPLTLYKSNFQDLEQHLHIADITLYIRDINEMNDHERNRLVIELMDQDKVFHKIPWQLKSIKAVHVYHTRMASGFVFETMDKKKFVFSGDTMPCELLAKVGKDADLLVHEATFEDGQEADARKKKHSTINQALNIGQMMRAKSIILTHFSSRYPRVPTITDRMIEMKNVSVAMDNMVVPFNKRAIAPLLLPLYRELFAQELSDYKYRQMQRELAELSQSKSS
ncbi:Ribonuclease Z [Aphelenchoides besseyi]|nr:Ribonuclease Z [Aphelenchoides besseyi]